MSLAAHLEAIAAELRAADLPPRANVEISPGRFDASELQRNSFRAPALRVTFLGAPRTGALPDNTRKYACAFAVFILTDGKDRATDGLDLIETVADVIEVNRFSSARVGLPKDVRLETLYTGEVDDKGVSIFAVAWVQDMRLGTSQGLGAPVPGALAVADGAELELTLDITELPEGI